MMRALFIAAGLALALSAGSAAAQTKSPDRRASALFQDGAAAYARGDFRAAADAFERAYKLVPAGAAAYNAGLAWQESGDRPRAVEAYERALRAKDLDATQSQDAKQRLEKLTPLLGRIHVKTRGGTVTLGYAREAPAPVSVWVEPGEHRVRYDSEEGESAQRRIGVTAGRVAEVDFARADAPPSDPSRPPPNGGGKVGADSGASSQRVWGFVALGVGAVAAGSAIFLGTRALAARDEFNDSNHQNADARDRAASLRLWANVAWGAAIVAGGVGVYLIVSAPSGETTTAVRIGPGSVGLAGTF